MRFPVPVEHAVRPRARYRPGATAFFPRWVRRWLVAGFRLGQRLRAAAVAATPARAAEQVELTALDLSRDEDGVYLNYTVDLELSRSVEDALNKGGAALLRRRSPGLPRSLVLARSPGRRRGAGLAHRLPAADLELPHHVRGADADLRDPHRGDGGDQPGVALEDRRTRADRGRQPALRRVQPSNSTPRCCRGRCRSAWRGSPTGRSA